MPARLVYSPKAYVFTKQANGAVLNFSEYVTAGQVQRLINQASTAQVTMRNPNKRFTIPKSPTFTPMDPITIFLERLKGFPVQVFTGYLDDVPYYQMYPGTITLQATCTLKRLLYTYWDPSLPYVNAFLNKFGWINNNGTLINVPATTNQKTVAQGGGQLSDGSIGKLLWAALTDIGDWKDTNIWIEQLPSGANGIAQRMARLMASLATSEAQAAQQFEAFLNTAIGSGTYGSSGTGGTTGVSPVLSGNSNAQKAFNYFVQQGINNNGAAGIVGNWQQESGNNPAESGGGIAQWGGDRYTGLLNFATSQGKPATDLGVQLAWAWHELNGDYKSVLTSIQNASSAQQAAIDFCNVYEEPGDPNCYGAPVWLSKRIQYAQDALTSYANNTSGTTAPGDTTTSSASLGSVTQTGSSPPTGSTGNVKSSYTSPFPGGPNGSSIVNNQRTDQGVDWDLGPVGSNIVAIGNGNVLGTSEPGWPGPGSPNNFMWYQLTDGPNQGAIIYYAEGISPTVGTGQVAKGQPIAKVTNQSSGVEFGYCTADGNATKPDFTGSNATDGGKRFARFMRAIGVTTRDDPGAGPYTPTGSSTTVGGGTAGSTSTGTTSAADTLLSTSKATAFTAQLEFPSLEDSVTAMILGSAGKGLMHDQQLLPFIQQLAQASMRSFQSLPNGDFYAFYPDYFGETNHRPPYWNIDDIEVLDGGINLTDQSLVTHQYAVGDNTYPVNNALLNELFSAGTITVFNAFLDPTAVGIDTEKQFKGGMADIMSQAEAVDFVKRYGARPQVSNYPMVRSPLYEMFLAYQQFMLAWSNQFSTPFSMTFMPELFPGGKVAFPDHGLQMYINSVTHAWDYTQGFTTDAVLSAPAVMSGSTNPDLPPNMVQALVGPVRTAKDLDPTTGQTKSSSAAATAHDIQSGVSSVTKSVSQGIDGAVKSILGSF